MTRIIEEKKNELILIDNSNQVFSVPNTFYFFLKYSKFAGNKISVVLSRSPEIKVYEQNPREFICNYNKMQIKINAPAEKVWGVLAHDFANVGDWATLVPKSSVNHEASVVNGSPVGGRICDTSIGDISEEFTAYDEEKMTFSFKGVITSKLFNKIISTNKVTSADKNTSVVKATPDIELTFLGKIMSPIIRIQVQMHTL